VLADVKLCI
jgi:hypothetical protein